jgi:two-component system sensor histidine kinase DesK
MRELGLMHVIRIRSGVAIGLLFLIGPISDLADDDLGTLRTTLVAAGTALFIVIYMLLLPDSRVLHRLGRARVWGPIATLPLLALAVLAIGAPWSFTSLFVYVVAVAGIRLPVEPAVAVIGAIAIGVGAGLWLTDASSSGIFSYEIVIVAIGAMMVAFGRKIVANRELHEAREELALLAVSEERLRIARDLHDLLGHSLSVIALKSELAGRLLERDPARAAREIEEIQTVTRTALGEVREAVQGYRRQGLADALEGARSALRAAGIESQLDEPPEELPADVEAVLAWAVREGATNVVRHSGAKRCSIRVRTEGSRAAVEVEDNGRSEQAAAVGGSGLTGLAERAQGVHGTLEAGARPEGGFRLRLSVPLARS